MESRLSRQEEVQCINSLRVLRRCRDSLVGPLQTSSCLFLFTVPCARHANAHARTCVSGRGWSVLGGSGSNANATQSLFSETQRFDLLWAKPLMHPGGDGLAKQALLYF